MNHADLSAIVPGPQTTASCEVRSLAASLPACWPAYGLHPLYLEPLVLDAATALRYGFANRVVPLADLMPTAIALAEKIAGNAPLSVQASKRVALRIIDGQIAGDDAHWDDNKRERKVLMASEDAREGPLAFAQKRKPEWKAR